MIAKMDAENLAGFNRQKIDVENFWKLSSAALPWTHFEDFFDTIAIQTQIVGNLV